MAYGTTRDDRHAAHRARKRGGWSLRHIASGLNALPNLVGGYQAMRQRQAESDYLDMLQSQRQQQPQYRAPVPGAGPMGAMPALQLGGGRAPQMGGGMMPPQMGSGLGMPQFSGAWSGAASIPDADVPRRARGLHEQYRMQDIKSQGQDYDRRLARTNLYHNIQSNIAAQERKARTEQAAIAAAPALNAVRQGWNPSHFPIDTYSPEWQQEIGETWAGVQKIRTDAISREEDLMKGWFDRYTKMSTPGGGVDLMELEDAIAAANQDDAPPEVIELRDQLVARLRRGPKNKDAMEALDKYIDHRARKLALQAENLTGPDGLGDTGLKAMKWVAKSYFMGPDDGDIEKELGRLDRELPPDISRALRHHISTSARDDSRGEITKSLHEFFHNYPGNTAFRAMLQQERDALDTAYADLAQTPVHPSEVQVQDGWVDDGVQGVEEPFQWPADPSDPPSAAPSAAPAIPYRSGTTASNPWEELGRRNREAAFRLHQQPAVPPPSLTRSQRLKARAQQRLQSTGSVVPKDRQIN